MTAIRPAIAAGSEPVASAATMPMRTRIERFAPSPSGTPRRSSAGGVTTRTSPEPDVWRSRSSHAPLTNSVSPACSFDFVPVRSVPPRCRPMTTRSPLGVLMPGKRCIPIRLDRGARR